MAAWQGFRTFPLAAYVTKPVLHLGQDQTLFSSAASIFHGAPSKLFFKDARRAKRLLAPLSFPVNQNKALIPGGETANSSWLPFAVLYGASGM